VCFPHFPSEEENKLTAYSLDMANVEGNSRKQTNLRRHVHVTPALHCIQFKLKTSVLLINSPTIDYIYCK
jgi:hypothetical protein